MHPRLLLAVFFCAAPFLGIGCHAQTTCGPPLTGQPCGFGGIAIQGSTEPSFNLGVGNPIHLVTGNKYQFETDLPASLGEPLLEIGRHYNALNPRASSFGRGWSHSYDTRLYRVAGQWQVVQADGSRVGLPDSTNEGSQVNSLRGTLHSQDDNWLWLWPNGQQLLFNQHGRLISIKAPGKTHSVSILRHQAGPQAGDIQEVVSQSGRRLMFHYQQLAGRYYVHHIDTPLGRFQYHYQAKPGSTRYLLAAVTRPDAMSRHYLYEPSRQQGGSELLTGIEIHMAGSTQPYRVASWSYDRFGRATGFTSSSPTGKTRHLALRYTRAAASGSNGITDVIDSNGGITRIHFRIENNRYAIAGSQYARCGACRFEPEPGPSQQRSIGSQPNLPGRPFDSLFNPMTLQRDRAGGIRQLLPDAPGWPGLQLNYDQNGQRTHWHWHTANTEHSRFNASGHIQQRLFANGDRWLYRYDALQRLRWLHASNHRSSHSAKLTWQHKLPVAIQGRHETELRRYERTPGKRNDPVLQQKALIRYDPPGSHIPLIIRDRFTYDTVKRQTHHHLPEGGTLVYTYSPEGRLAAIHWLDRQGTNHVLLNSLFGQPGYQYGNGLRMRALWHQGKARMLALDDGTQTVWAAYLNDNHLNQLVQEDYQINPLFMPGHPPDKSRGMPTGHKVNTSLKNRPANSAVPYEQWRYQYDQRGRLVQASDSSRQLRYAWHSDGSSAAFYDGSAAHATTIKRDASGLPLAHREHRLLYNPLRRLEQVWQQGRLVISNRHNAFGHRIRQATSNTSTHYFYLGNQLVAEARDTQQRPQSLRTQSTQPDISRRYVYAGLVPVALIDYTSTQAAGTPYAIHSDLLGAPRLLTDQNQTIRWLATYTPTGQAQRIAGDLELDLRLPGQIVDRATGWHDNVWRTYLPDSGQYLESDPLGPLPGSQAFGYARQQPRRYIDPSGLLLFAFDGTRNSPITQTNVWKISQRYLDGPAFYHAGPGNSYSIDWGAISGAGADDILASQWERLLDELENSPPETGEIIPIDIIGFSRGAALARHFGNQINQHVSQGLFSYQHPLRGLINACVDLRFMGLFDTVTQFGLNGSSNNLYDFSIASSWAWVAHAVALQERRWLFPLTAASHTAQNNISEAPFIGAHADIGGGLAIQNRRAVAADGDLPNVALNWMLWQARAAALQFSNGNPDDASIVRPIVHDDRSSTTRALDTDRRVDAPDGSTQYSRQADDPDLGRRQREETEALIKRYDGWRSSSARAVGEVDMDGYARWLYETVGWQAPPI